MGLLFLLAGMEIDLKSLGGRQGGWAWGTWAIGFVVAVAFAAVFTPGGNLTQAVALGLAISSTALGTLLPILKDRGLASTRLGHGVMTHGAVGEIGPVVVMALLLTSHSPLQAGLLMGFFVLVVLAAITVPTRVLQRVGIGRDDDPLSKWSLRTLLRAVMLLLTGLMALAAILEFDVVLGAFAAGVALARISGRHTHTLAHSLEQVGFGFFIPMFFVASGMAIEVAALGLDAVPTMVFDEVDSGIGGAVAEIVGQKLRALGDRRQVLCVTHLPQVAAQGHAHYRVSKAPVDGMTQSSVESLDAKQREEELARMLGGVEVSKEARAAAKRLLSNAV